MSGVGCGICFSAASRVQNFLMPDAARTLVLDGVAFRGAPAAYADNSGFVTTHVVVQDNVRAG